MGKKHLLYIHNEKFQDEQEKSKLVNELLENYYGKRVQPRANENHYQIPKENILQEPKLKKVIETKAEKICPHGFPANGWSCKKGCK